MDASGTHEKITPPQEPQNSPGQLPRTVRGHLDKLQHWILPILLPCPSLVSSLVFHVGCALLTWVRMSWNTWSHCWPGRMRFLGGSSYSFLKFINSKPCPVFISISFFLTPSSLPTTSEIIPPYTMSSKFSWSFPLMSPLSCLSYRCCSNQSLDSLLLPKMFFEWNPSFWCRGIAPFCWFLFPPTVPMTLLAFLRDLELHLAFCPTSLLPHLGTTIMIR